MSLTPCPLSEKSAGLMTIKNVPKAKSTDPAQVQLSGVKDGDTFTHQTLSQVFQQVAGAPVGVAYSVEVAPVAPTAAVAATPQ